MSLSPNSYKQKKKYVSVSKIKIYFFNINCPRYNSSSFFLVSNGNLFLRNFETLIELFIFVVRIGEFLCRNFSSI